MSVILITGTSSGIGLATAVHFARKRHDVYAAVRNPTIAGALAEAMAKEPLPITRVTIDVDDASSVRRGVDEVLAKSGRVDVLVNNAGLGGGGAIEDVPIDWAKTLFETNYFGAIRMIQAVLPGMRARGSGVIVNVSSVAGRYVPAGHGHDAQRLVAGRRRISDEEFVADASAATDAEWEALMRRRYGFEWP